MFCENWSGPKLAVFGSKSKAIAWVFGENWSGPKLAVLGSKSKAIALGFWFKLGQVQNCLILAQKVRL